MLQAMSSTVAGSCAARVIFHTNCRLGSPRSAFAQVGDDFPPRSAAARSHSLDPSFSKEMAHAARQSGEPAQYLFLAPTRLQKVPEALTGCIHALYLQRGWKAELRGAFCLTKLKDTQGSGCFVSWQKSGSTVRLLVDVKFLM